MSINYRHKIDKTVLFIGMGMLYVLISCYCVKMNSVASQSKLVIEQSKKQLTLESKVYAGLFILVLSFIISVLLVSFFLKQKPSIISGRNSAQNKLQVSRITRLPILMDRVVRDSSAYVYVKPTSIRSELGIPWGKKIGVEKKER